MPPSGGWPRARRGELIGYARSVERGGLFELSRVLRPSRAAVGRRRSRAARPRLPERPGRGARHHRHHRPAAPRRATTRAGTVGPLPDRRHSKGTPQPRRGGPRRGGRAGRPAGRRSRSSSRSRPPSSSSTRGDEFGWLLEHARGLPVPPRRRADRLRLHRRAAHAGPIAALERDRPGRHPGPRRDRAPLSWVEAELVPRAADDQRGRHAPPAGPRVSHGCASTPSSCRNRPFGRFDRYIGFSPPFVL